MVVGSKNSNGLKWHNLRFPRFFQIAGTDYGIGDTLVGDLTAASYWDHEIRF
jgi:hypothetical protein